MKYLTFFDKFWILKIAFFSDFLLHIFQNSQSKFSLTPAFYQIISNYEISKFRINSSFEKTALYPMLASRPTIQCITRWVCSVSKVMAPQENRGWSHTGAPDCEDSSPFARPLTSDQVTHWARGVDGRGRELDKLGLKEKDFQLSPKKHIFVFKQTHTDSNSILCSIVWS